jgi:hypothetical protein
MINCKDSGGTLRFQITGGGACGVRGNLFCTGTGVMIGSNSSDYGGGVNVLGMKNATVPTTNPTGGNILYVDTNSRFAIRRPSGSATNIGGRLAAVTSTTTIASSASLTALQAFTVPAADVVVGQGYEVEGYGVYSVTGTPTLTFALYWNGIAGTVLASIPAVTAASGITNAPFRYKARVIWRSTTSCVAGLDLTLVTDTSTGATASFLGVPAAVTTGLTSTGANDLTVGFTWSASSASNTISLLGGDVRSVI